MNELPNTRRAERPREVCVLAAFDSEHQSARACLQSAREHATSGVSVVELAASTVEIEAAISRCAPADVIVLSEPCRLAAGWVERLSDAAYSDTNIASASALSDHGTPLATGGAGDAASGERLAAGVERRTRRLRPRISRAVGPCVYLRRDALQLAGALDADLDPRAAIELDLAQRCVLAGLTHVVADDVVVQRIASGEELGTRAGRESIGDDGSGLVNDGEAEALMAPIAERYPYLAETPLADSGVLGDALRAVREPSARLDVTLDARALDGAITGTHVHVLELIRALARTEQLELRLLIRAERIDREARELLAGLAHTELLAVEALDPATARTTVFHRPQQTFSPGDVALGLMLGERFVISQLDLIAYRNPGYFADAATWEDYRAASRHGLSAAERVVVFSEHTRDELTADALVERSRIRVVPPGIDHAGAGAPLRPAALGAERSSELESGFLLCLGTDFRHKNRIFALRLLRALRERHDWQGRLVLAGMHIERGSSAALERAYLREHPGLSGAVVSLGPVDERERAWLTSNARAIVYPSVYEGFGLVPFEAALCDVPCLFAPRASLAETAPAGTATIVPWDAAASADAAYALLSDDDARKRQIGALAARARTFTWDAAAAATVAIYREAAAAPVRDSATLSRDLVKREARLSVQHDAEVLQLTGEREHAKRMYDELHADVGFGLSLIGPRGALPERVQRALLALTARPALSRPLFSAVSGVFVLVRALSRPFASLPRRPR